MRIILYLLLALSSIPCAGQSIFRNHQISGGPESYIYSHALDSLGNSYLNIYTQGRTPITIYGKSFNLEEGSYILRFDASDSLTFIYDIWSLSLGDIRIGDVQTMAADKFGNLYIAGIVGNVYAGFFGYTKLSPEGEILWQVTSPQNIDSYVQAMQILIDDQGNSYIAGNVASVFFFGVRLYKSIIYPNHDFLLKISATGNVEWVHTSDASDYLIAVSAMRFDPQGNIIIGGDFHTEIKVGSAALTNSLGDNYSNMYITSISPSGEFLWLKGFTGPGNFYMLDMEVDPGGNFYFCGRFQGSITFGDIPITTRVWRETGFILGKISNDFEVEWIKYDDANDASSGGYLANTPGGVLVSGAAIGDFHLDELTIPALPLSKYQAFVARVQSDGSTSWLKGYGEALHPGVYSETPTHFYFKPGYQLSEVTEQCHFVSGIFVNTLDTHDGLVTTPDRAIFKGILSESTDPVGDLGPDFTMNLCNVDTCTIPLNSTLGTNYFSAVQGPLPAITIIDNANIKLGNIAYGVTKFKWTVQNCTSQSSKLITINRTDSSRVQQPNASFFCESELNDATLVINGGDITWYDDETLTSIIEEGNTFVPTKSDTVYVTNGRESCISEPVKIVIAVVDDPQPPSGENIQTLGTGETVADLHVSGMNVKWYADMGNEIPSTTPLINDATYFATQTVSGCESQPLPVKVLLITGTEYATLSCLYHPNPVKDVLFISFEQHVKQVVVKDVFGKPLIIKKIEANTNTTELPLNSLQSGIYFIQVGEGEKTRSFKIVKE